MTLKANGEAAARPARFTEIMPDCTSRRDSAATCSTAKAHMRNMGIPNDITEIALNHALIGMEAVYDVREEIPERRQDLEKWESFIEPCEAGPPWNVQPIRRVA